VPSAVPAGTGEHVPSFPVTLHDSHTEQLADAQHTPSTQLPLAHSPPAPQVWPVARLQTPPAAHA
jgi:hypothetical protein